MKGISFKLLNYLDQFIKNKFNRISLKFLGIVPEKSGDKDIIFTTSNEPSMVSLFLHTLGHKPNKMEEETLKTMLRVSNNYLDSLRDRTSAKTLNEVNAYFTKQVNNKQAISIKEVDKIINKEMTGAANHLKLIINAESNKAKNTGTALQISKIAEEKGIEDPTVFFIIVDDDRTGFYEYILHTLPDKKTPRLWKLSEVSTGYYKNGEQYPSLSGLHVGCRCMLTYLAPGFGFDKNGKVKFIGLDHDEFKIQREKYGLPSVPEKPKKKNGKWVHD